VPALGIHGNQAVIVSINAIVCYESEPTGVTKMNAKWLVMKPFGFFVFATGKWAGKIGTVLLM
jgi:hypothetical protein